MDAASDDASTGGGDASVVDSGPPPTDAGGSDAAATFACGPTKHCLEATQYCDITSTSVGPIARVQCAKTIRASRRSGQPGTQV